MPITSQRNFPGNSPINHASNTNPLVQVFWNRLEGAPPVDNNKFEDVIARHRLNHYRSQPVIERGVVEDDVLAASKELPGFHFVVNYHAPTSLDQIGVTDILGGAAVKGERVFKRASVQTLLKHAEKARIKAELESRKEALALQVKQKLVERAMKKLSPKEKAALGLSND